MSETPDDLFRRRIARLAERNPQALERVAELCRLSLYDLHRLLEEPGSVPLCLVAAMAQEFGVDANFIVASSASLDHTALMRACLVALGEASFSLNPIRGGVAADGDPSRFTDHDVRTSWQFTVAGHLATVIGAVYEIDVLNRHAGIRIVPASGRVVSEADPKTTTAAIAAMADLSGSLDSLFMSLAEAHTVVFERGLPPGRDRVARRGLPAG